MIYCWKAYQISKKILFWKFSEILYIYKIILKTNNQIFASICIFGEYFCRSFHIVHQNYAYDIPLDL
jgi:hypothetical protein